MTSEHALLATVPILVIGAVLAAAVRTLRAQAVIALATQGIAAVVVLVAIVPVLAGGAPLTVVWPWPAPIGAIVFRVDALGGFFLAWSLPLTWLGTVYAIGYLQPAVAAGRNGGSHFALLNLTCVAFVLIYSVQNALVFLLGWEIAAVSAWLLVIWDYRSQKVRFAGFNYLVSTHVGLFVLVAAFMLLHARTSSMNFAAFGAFLASRPPERALIFVLLGIAFALKSAFFPFHTWLPRAHAAAPAHVSALMSGVIHKAGLFGFLRFTILGGTPEAWMGWCVLGFGLASAFFGVLSTTVQRDLKRMLGYSSTENVGIAATAFGVGYLGWSWGEPRLVVLGFAGGLFHLLNHALFKCLLFYAAGSVYRATHSVDLERLGGLARTMPRTAVLFLIGGLAMCGLPPLNGFASELVIYASLLGGGASSAEGDVALICAAALLAFVGATSALATTRAFGLAFLGVPRDAEVHARGDAPVTMAAPMIVLAVLVVALGLVPGLALAALGPVVELFAPEVVGPGAVTVPGFVDAMAWAARGLALALVLVIVLAWRPSARSRQSVTWGCGYTGGTARMQYTGSSFAASFAQFFGAALPTQQREKLPQGPFPAGDGHLGSHHVDAVERRMFEVLGQGEQLIHETSARISEQPRFGFAAGAIAIIVIVAVVVGRSA